MSDKEDVIQALVVLLLTKEHFEQITVARTRVLIQELVFIMLKLLHEHVCVILANN